jgi:hypothetical protein
MEMTKSVSTEDAKFLNENRKKMYDQAEQYRKAYLDKKSGLIDQKYLEIPACLVCGAIDSREIF